MQAIDKTALKSKVEAELARLGVNCTHTRPEGIAVYFDENLPAGWVRVSDGTGESYGPCEEIAAVLADVPATGEVTDDGTDCDWEATWEALGNNFADRAPESSQDWPSDLFKTEQLEEGTINDDPDTLVAIETNVGIRYTVGPHGVSCCALSSAFDYNDWHTTAEEAKAAYLALGLQALDEAETND